MEDPLKDMDWKKMGTDTTTTTAATATNTSSTSTNNKMGNGQPEIKKRLPKKVRQIPECYFLPRRSLPSAIAFYGSFIVAGVGAGMLLEVWMDKKVKEDGGVIWEFNK